MSRETYNIPRDIHCKCTSVSSFKPSNYASYTCEKITCFVYIPRVVLMHCRTATVEQEGWLEAVPEGSLADSLQTG